MIDVTDLDRGAAFWGGLLGMVERHRFEEYLWLGEVAPGIQLILQQTADPKHGKNRMHVDLTGDPAQKLERTAVDLGAVVVREVDNPAYALVVMADPDGNEFCISREKSPATTGGSQGGR